MKAEDLRLEEIIAFSEGEVSLSGRRLVVHSVDAFAQFRKDLVEMVGLKQTRRILTRFGYFWGHADAAAMKRIFEWESLTEWIKAGPRMHSLQGVTRVVVTSLDLDEETGRFHMEVTWHDSGEAQEHLLELGKADEPSCWMLVGYASGYASFCMGKNIYFIEQKCRATGDRTCSAVGKDEESWGDALKPYLPFFEADDIWGKIQDLTEELKRKTRQLAKQRREIDELGHGSIPSFVEVRSESFRRVVDLAGRVAGFDTSVLVTGETGVGKEVVARYIHRLSHRSDGAFLPVNCGALPDTLLEGELFGHKAGAFTGAIEDRIGLFEQAKGGTLFLDEIGDISPAMQLKLLRVLQEREVIRLGENTPRTIDARVIAATNRDLEKAISEGAFREDLFYRLRVIEIDIPPLRERKEDILPLARYFVKTLSKKLGLPNLRLDATCLDVLQAHSWPGNVRELENAIERAAVLSKEEVIRPEGLPPNITRPELDRMTVSDPTQWTLKEIEARHIRAVLERVGGNRTRAAELLGISPTTLWRRIGRQED